MHGNTVTRSKQEVHSDDIREYDDEATGRSIQRQTRRPICATYRAADRPAAMARRIRRTRRIGVGIFSNRQLRYRDQI